MGVWDVLSALARLLSGGAVTPTPPRVHLSGAHVRLCPTFPGGHVGGPCACSPTGSVLFATQPCSEFSPSFHQAPGCPARISTEDTGTRVPRGGLGTGGGTGREHQARPEEAEVWEPAGSRRGGELQGEGVQGTDLLSVSPRGLSGWLWLVHGGWRVAHTPPGCRWAAGLEHVMLFTQPVLFFILFLLVLAQGCFFH